MVIISLYHAAIKIEYEVSQSGSELKRHHHRREQNDIVVETVL